jgi:serine/threonine-protein kinase
LYSAPLSFDAVVAIKHILNELNYEITRKIAEGKLAAVFAAVQLGEDHFRKVDAVKPR